MLRVQINTWLLSQKKTEHQRKPLYIRNVELYGRTKCVSNGNRRINTAGGNMFKKQVRDRKVDDNGGRRRIIVLDDCLEC